MIKNRIVKVGAIALAVGAPLGVAQAGSNYIYVETTADEVVPDGLCSLREAVTNANDNAQTYGDCEAGTIGFFKVASDNISFATGVGTTITLASPLPAITDEIVIEAGGRTIKGAFSGSMFVFNNATNETLKITDATLTNSAATVSGAVVQVMAGNFSASKVTFRDSVTIAKGGAISLAAGTSAYITDSRFFNNQAASDGGAIYANTATTELSGVEFDGNQSNAWGGGVYVTGGSLTMSHGALVNNAISAVFGAYGGAIYAINATVNLNNVTVANNTGGIRPGLSFYNVGGGLANVTVANNKASVVPTSTTGAGLNVTADATAGFKIRNSLVYNNKDSSGVVANCVLTSVTDDGYNLENGTGCFTAATSGQTNGSFVLSSTPNMYGGTIPSLRLFDVDTQAIDGGNPAGCLDMADKLLTRDARSATAVRDADGDGDGVRRCDIGAYEFAALGGMKLSLDKYSTVEGDANPVIRVTRRGEPLAINATVSTQNGTAIAPGDYTALNMPATYPVDWISGTTTLAVVDDSVLEANENLAVKLTTTDPGVDLIGETRGLTITDNDVVVSVNTSTSTPNMDETKTTWAYNVRVKLSAAAGFNVTVPFTLAGTASNGVDYTKTSPAGSTLTIPAGDTSADIIVQPINDKLAEPNESLIVTLGTPSAGVLGTTASYTITVVSEDTAPVLTQPSGTLSVDEDGYGYFPYAISDADGDTTSITIKTQPDDGVASIDTQDPKSIVYIPNANFYGDSDEIVVTVTDGYNPVDYTFMVIVNPVNDAPVITEGATSSVTMSEDGSPTAFVLTLHATDADSDPLVWSAIQGLHGAVNVDGGVVSYTPAANYNGNDSFIVTVFDGTVSVSHTVNVTVEAVSDVPLLMNDTITTDEDQAASINVLSNDVHPDGLSMEVITSDQNLGNGASIAWVGSVVTYTPPANFSGSDAFNYRVRDSSGVEVNAVVYVTVNAKNDLPVITEGATYSVTMSEDSSPLPFALTLHATDVDGDTLVWGAAGASHGVVSVNGGVVSYNPNANYNGTDSFIVTVSDGKGGSASNTVTVTVVAVNDAPQAVNDSATINEDTQYDPVFDLMSGINVVGNDLDVDGDTLYLLSSDSTTALGGTVMRHIDDTLSYFPAPNFHGSDSFSYTVSDGKGGQAVGTVVITVTPVNDAPSLTLSASALEVVAGASVSIDVTPIDVDGLDGAVITARSVEGLGVVTVSGNRVTYAATTAGSDTVQITVTDAGGLSATSTAGVTVAAAPVAASSGGGGGGGSISWLLLLAGLPLVRRRRAA